MKFLLGKVHVMTKEEKRESDKKRRLENPERYKEGKAKHYQENKSRYDEKSKQYAKNNPDEIRNRNLQRNYGITLEQYNEIFKNQNGVCAICGKPPSEDKNGKFISLAVDHHHKYKGIESVRGLLCWTCNRRMISNLGDRENSVELFKKASEYLEVFRNKIKSRE